MPYKDPEKQRRAVVEAMREYRAKQIFARTMGYLPLLAWMQVASKHKQGSKTEIFLVRIEGTDQWFPVVGSREYFIKKLEEMEFPYTVHMVDKKFQLISEEEE